MAHVELTLDVVRGAPKLSYLARRPPGFPDVFEHGGHRFDSLEEGWYDPLPVPREDGQHLLDGFEWPATTHAPQRGFVLKRRPAAAIAFVRSEEYSGLTSRRRLLAGVECAVLYHESVSALVEARMKVVADGPLRPIVDPGMPAGWRVLLHVNVKPNADALPDLEALEVDLAVELMTVGGLRLGRRAAWLVDCPPTVLVSGMQQRVRVDGRLAKVGPGGAVEWERVGGEPGVHVVEAGRAHLRVEIIEGSLADGLPTISSAPLGASHSLALARGRWDIIGRRPGEIVETDLPTQTVLRVPFEPYLGDPLRYSGSSPLPDSLGTGRNRPRGPADVTAARRPRVSSPRVPPIPPFSSDGLLPPYLGASPGEASGLMSPYKASIKELVAHFATSPERIAILKGFLQYRADLHAFGLLSGFQWIDGSFVERIDAVRAPRDIDLVTFFERPPALASDAALDAAVRGALHLFSKPLAKPRYLCDVHFVDLSQAGSTVVGQTRYWFGLFSHKRATFQWKGMLEVTLGTLADDNDAAKMIAKGTP